MSCSAVSYFAINMLGFEDVDSQAFVPMFTGPAGVHQLWCLHGEVLLWDL